MLDKLLFKRSQHLKTLDEWTELVHCCSLFQRLKQLTKRQVDLNFEQLVQRYQAKQKEQEEMAFKAKYVVIFE